MAIKKLNIVMTYPVIWCPEKVFRDYIQNFYDAVGWEEFDKRFSYEYEKDGGILRMSSDVGFDKEWLMYVGASTKRNTDGNFAGQFGEGFKIASLAAYRDHHFSIMMRSRDWCLKVTEIKEIIDQREFSCMAYDITKREEIPGAVLELSGVNKEQYDTFLRALNHFYYAKNPVFGETIYADTECAVYEIANTTGRVHRSGRLYVRYQYRNDLPIPLIICDHYYKVPGDDRDRESLSIKDQRNCIVRVLNRLDPCNALKILEILRPYWGLSAYHKEKELERICVRELVERICLNNDAKNEFQQKYGEQLVAWFDPCISDNRKKCARSWFAGSEFRKKRRMVINNFSLLGIKSIDRLCQENNGFNILVKPDVSEYEMINLLREISIKHFGDIVCYDEIPECRLIENDGAPAEGLAHLTKEINKRKNAFGLVTRYQVENVYITRKILNEGDLGAALSVYLHELLHQYGGDCSRQFHNAILLMNHRLLHISDMLQPYAKTWQKMHLEKK